MRQLLAEGAEPALADDGGVTPLMLAAESGSAEAVAALLGGVLSLQLIWPRVLKGTSYFGAYNIIMQC